MNRRHVCSVSRFPIVASAACAAICAAAIALGAGDGPLPEKIDYGQDVQPILSENCFKCHGFDDKTRDSGRRLDTRAGALKDIDGIRAIVPGKLKESDFWERIHSTDRDEVMPPPKEHKKLTERQIAVMDRWIEQGAKYDVHWAFKTPVKPSVPRIADAPGLSPIDAFVRERLQKEGLAPAPEADRATLLRRVSLDLTGLPPTLAETDAFVADASPDAYEKVVDRLLASPRYGERWARWWLDAARYADSDGYEKDLPRQEWAWRDWVIRSLNDDLPWNDFVIAQIAGDLLPNATQDQKVATGFLRNSMVSEEGAIIAEQYRMEEMVDRMDAIGKSVLGLTIQCAQCHSHKFDPLTHTEYYQMLACLNNTYEAKSRIYTPEQLATIARLTQGIDAETAQLETATPDWEKRVADWLAGTKTEWSVLHPSESIVPGGLAHPNVLADGSVLTVGFRPTKAELVTTTDLPPGQRITGLRFEALTHGDLAFGGPGRSVNGLFEVSEMKVEVARADAPEQWKSVALREATADFAQPAGPIEQAFRNGKDDKRTIGPAAFLIDGNEDTAWGVDRGPGRRNADLQAVAQLAEPLTSEAGMRMKITLLFRHGGADIHGRQNHFLGRARVSVTQAEKPVAAPVSERVRAAGGREAFDAWRATVPEFAGANARIDALWKQWPEGGTVLDMREREPEFARETHLLKRGQWDQPGEAVAPGVPAFLHPLAQPGPTDRLGFARWLVDPRSPTTARVLVNRVWQAWFGTGIEETPEDFGTRAPAPSHPELLDWLATQFMDSGWSLKKLNRSIALSATYRQSSRMTPESVERDPQNRLLARGPRFRAEAEMVRDIALSAAGLLDGTIGGPSIFPPVPESVFAQSFLDVDFWKTATGSDRYRRGLYVFRRRSQPDPVLSAFDAPTGETSCPRRMRSDTPLAALVTLNEPVFVEAARALALRTLREAGPGDEARAAHAFRLCTGREPTAEETARLLQLTKFARQRVADGWIAPRAIATGQPESLPALPSNTTPADAAAWTIAARVLLNLDETLTKN
ncbi:MAG: PSD1 and planctomycete cytochrome C domain-containing protein [Chthoniobacteraceae bacterium]